MNFKKHLTLFLLFFNLVKKYRTNLAFLKKNNVVHSEYLCRINSTRVNYYYCLFYKKCKRLITSIIAIEISDYTNSKFIHNNNYLEICEEEIYFVLL